MSNDNNTLENFMALVTNRTEGDKEESRSDRYYRKLYESGIYSSKKTISWNWVAFSLGPIWMVYRKMYLYAFLLFGIAWATDVVLFDI